MAYAKIEAERAEHGLTRTALAEKLGISLPTYNNYVCGTNPIPSDKLIALANLFDCSIDYLLGRQ